MHAHPCALLSGCSSGPQEVADGKIIYVTEHFSYYGVVGKVKITDPDPHTHSYGHCNQDGINHWEECSCGEVLGRAIHSFKWGNRQGSDKSGNGLQAREMHCLRLQKSGGRDFGSGSPPQTGDSNNVPSGLHFCLCPVVNLSDLLL